MGVNIKQVDYHYFLQQVWVNTDPSKVINLFGQLDWGTYFNGQLTITDLTLQFAPSPHFSLSGKFNHNRFKNVGDQEGANIIDLYTLEGRFALNPRLQLIAFYQQNSENDSKNYNIRLSWEYRPLSFLYIVLNRRGFKDLSNLLQLENHRIVKLSYLQQI